MKPDELSKVPVMELLSPTVTFSPLDPVSRVVGFLRESGLYEAFMEEGGRTALVTVRDLLGVPDIAKVKISSLMHHVPRLTEGNTVGDAAMLMHEYRIRSLPIYRGMTLAGQLAAPSIVARLLDTDIGSKVSSLMTPNPIRVHISDHLSKARELMVRRKVDQLPVMEGDRLYGIISSDQIVFNLMPRADRNVKGDWRERRFDTLLKMSASRDFVTNNVGDSLQSIFANMSAKATNYSMIMNLDEVQGIVTYRDFMKILAHRVSEDIPIYMIGLPEDPFEAETATTKFVSAVRLLRKAFPEIIEARAIIKTGETESPRKKYEVRIFMRTPYGHYSYHVFSRELADAFDYVNGWVKKIMSQHKPIPRRTVRVPPFLT